MSEERLPSALRTSDLVSWSKISLICKAGSKNLTRSVRVLATKQLKDEKA